MHLLRDLTTGGPMVRFGTIDYPWHQRVSNGLHPHYIYRAQIEDLENFSNTKYQDFEVSYNVICDHIRMLSFAIADGVVPSNDGRGYVVRRVLRRGSKFAMNLEIKEPILYKLVDSVVSTMSSHYPELKEKQEYIEQTILSEEQSFLRTLENGVIQFEKIVSSTSGSEIHGKDCI